DEGLLNGFESGCGASFQLAMRRNRYSRWLRRLIASWKLAPHRSPRHERDADARENDEERRRPAVEPVHDRGKKAVSQAVLGREEREVNDDHAQKGQRSGEIKSGDPLGARAFFHGHFLFGRW